MQLKALLFNDTSFENHHGCRLVTRNLIAALARHDVVVTKRFANRDKFWRREDTREYIKKSDLIIINGEGTFHDSSPYAEALLRLAENDYCPVFLVNTTYYKNDKSWKFKLAKLQGIYARDSQSAAELGELVGGGVDWIPDLSMSGSCIPSSKKSKIAHGKVVFGDSVFKDITEELRARSKDCGGVHIPIMTSPVRVKPNRSGFRRFINIVTSDISRRVSGMVERDCIYFKDEEQYLDSLSGSALHITGRFHGVCISLLARTNFIAIESNTPKISRALDDVGLKRDRFMKKIGDVREERLSYIINDAEERLIEAYVALSRRGVDAMVRDIIARI